MELLTVLQLVVLFIQAHWDSLSIVSLLGGAVFMALKEKAYQKAGMIALELVREVAVHELDGVEKRKMVVDQLWKRLPLWAQKVIGKEDNLVAVAEQAYQLLKGELKIPTTEQPQLPQVPDPTQPVVNEDELRVTSPVNLTETKE